jgi:hypothetical protein
MQQESKKHFFISYNKADIIWAEWIAWELEEAGYATIVQAWDFRPGFNFVIRMQQASKEAERIIAILSPDYLTAEFTKPEWSTAFGNDPGGEKGLLLPIRVRQCEPEGMLKQIVYIDLVDLEEQVARTILLDGVKTERAKPQVKPKFPGASQQSAQPSVFPGSLPPIWNIPHQRNPDFYTEREGLIAELHASLNSGHAEERGQIVYGGGGVGKTQIALEYAYRHALEYRLVWWLRSEESAVLAADYAGLYGKLELLPRYTNDQNYMNYAVRRWLEQNDGWLLIFDNAVEADDLRAFVPQSGDGHVLITSRNQGWQGIGVEREIKPLSPTDAAEILLKRTA